jgi:type II secretory ATPase GspE/PulE/Tfp pilus assembly ATPase PilB-like protein
MVSKHSFESALRLYDTLPSIRQITKGVTVSEEDIKRFTDIHSFDRLQAALAGATVTDIVVILVAAALNTRSSDIHIEAEEKTIAVRFRIDGILTKVAAIPGAEWVRMISRVKLISGLKINVTDQPQDGRFTISLANEKIEVRVSTIPTAYGESVVMRLLRSSATGIKLESLGMRAPYDEILKAQIQRPNGMIITTGPTGSGKTTTLYAILLTLNTPDVKIITLEDPVEYKLEGIAQSQIDHTKDYTFAKGLRSILRQDPDVIMVGEIRDLETAEIAIRAALTGHLVFSTLHTNDAPSAFTRLIDMGIEPFLVASSVESVMAQRLVRTICPHCKEEQKVERDYLLRIGFPADEIETAKFWHGVGCEQCRQLGYQGRMGIYELLVLNESLRPLILNRSAASTIAQKAIAFGMRTLRIDGWNKVRNAQTTIEEVLRVTQIEEHLDALVEAKK